MGFALGYMWMTWFLAGPNEQRIQEVKDALSQRFSIKDLGKLHHFLRVTIESDEECGQIWIGKPTYTRNLLEKFEMQDCKSVGTPVDVNTQLVKATDEEEPINQQLYQSAIGSLMYLCVSTRPHIAYAIGSLAKFTSKPINLHWMACYQPDSQPKQPEKLVPQDKPVLCYLKGIMDYGI